MAMNEDSVVSSLNELRRMANDRARRETEARVRVEDNGGWDQRGGRRRTTEVQGAAAGHAPTLMGGHDGGQAPQAGYGYNYGYGYNHTAQPAGLPDIPVEAPRQRSAAGPVLLTILLLGGAAAGGYWKLQQDWQVTLKVRDQALLAAEEGRNKAVEQAARAEQLAKVQIANCSKGGAVPAEKAAAITPAPGAASSLAAAVLPAATKPVAAKMSKAEKKRARKAAASHRAFARAVLPPVEEEKKAAPLPKIANKKKLNDDPLAGLKM